VTYVAGTLEIVLQKSVVEIATKAPHLVWGWGWGPRFLGTRAWHGLDEHSRTWGACAELLHAALPLHLDSRPSRPLLQGRSSSYKCPSAALGKVDPFTCSELATEDFGPGSSSWESMFLKMHSQIPQTSSLNNFLFAQLELERCIVGCRHGKLSWGTDSC